MRSVFDLHQKNRHAPYVNQKRVDSLYILNTELNNQNRNLVMMLEPHSFFTNMVDELVEFSEYDSELADGLRWIDSEAQKRGITFYEMVFFVLHKYDVNVKAREWLETRN